VPERLAVLGDVHANLPALEAVLAAIGGHGITNGAFTGDLVMRGPDPEGCVREVMRTGWPCALGNTDGKVTKREPDPDHPKAQRVGSRAWTATHLSETSLRFLSTLPAVVRVELGGWKVAIVHGDPAGTIAPSTSKRLLAAIAHGLGADCVVSGHTHRPLIREEAGCLFLNPGSAGEALAEDDRRPRWAWLEARSGGLHAHLEQVAEPLARLRPRD
jgi:putative phosphoesterase